MKIKVASISSNGNINLDVCIKDLESLGIRLGDAIDLETPCGKLEEIPLHSGLYCKMFDTVLIADCNAVFLAIRGGSAAEKFHLKVGQKIDLTLSKRRLFWEKENAYSFREITDASLYEGIEPFANFRSLFPNGTMFFRSSSPIDDAYGRAGAVIACIKKYGIRVVIDVADSSNEFADLLLMMDERTQDMLSECIFVVVGDDSGLYSKQFESSVSGSIRAIINLEGPFLIHCRAGKRRSGFVCAVLQGLVGMMASEIELDYMISYKNNNGIVYGDNPRRYEYLRDDTIRRILRHVNGEQCDDLARSSAKYLRKIGMKTDEIAILKQKLINDKSPH